MYLNNITGLFLLKAGKSLSAGFGDEDLNNVVACLCPVRERLPGGGRQIWIPFA
jgi:hypothetical protein